MIQSSLKESLQHCFSLFYPRLCLVCGTKAPPKKEIMCLSCQHKLPQTLFHLEKENPLAERFWGRLPLTAATALYHFSKGGRTQQLIHQLKYNNKPIVGKQLGQYYGKQLMSHPVFSTVDCIVPVPLHPRKQHRRGYNQSAEFAAGLSHSMGIPALHKVLKRDTFTDTQTHKSRQERMDNVFTAFALDQPAPVKGKHILLVDDVVTTGATLEACGAQLLRVEGVQLSLATIGFAAF